MTTASNLPKWQLDPSIAIFATYTTLLVASASLIFGGFETTSPLAISLLANGAATILAGYGGLRSSPSAFLCICLTSVFLLCGIATSFGTRDLNHDRFDGTYSILCSFAHLAYTAILVYKQVESQHGSNPGQEVEKKDDSFVQSNNDESSDKGVIVTFPSRDIVFQFGDTFRMRAKVFIPMVLGSAMIYRAVDFNTGLGIICASVSGTMSALLLFMIDVTRYQEQNVDLDKALQKFVGALISVGIFCYIAFTYTEMDPDITWWRVAFPITWIPWITHTLFLYAKRVPWAAWSRGDFNIVPAGSPTHSLSPDRDLAAAIDSGSSVDSDEYAAKFQFRWQKDPDTIERHWLNGQPWIQISPRAFVLVLVSCFIIGSLAANASPFETSGVAKAAAFYLILAFTLACRGHSPVGDTPELMFVHVKHSFVDWKPAAGALTATAIMHLILQNPVVEAFGSFLVPIACVYMVRLLLPVLSKPADSIKENNDSIDTNVNTEDIESQVSRTNDRVVNIEPTLVYSSSKIRNLDLRVMAMGFSLTILDFIVNDEFTGWPKTCQVSSFTTVILLIYDSGAPAHRDLEPGLLYILTVVSFAIFNHCNFLGMFYLFNDDIHDNGDPSLAVEAAIFFALFGMMIINNRRIVRRQEEHELPMQNGRKPVVNSLLINIDPGRFGVNCRWQLRSAQVSIVMLLAFICGCSNDSWPLPLNTTIASLIVFLLIVGFQLRPSRIEEKISTVHLAALGICVAATAIAVTASQLEVIVSWTKWQVVTCTTLVVYHISLTWIPWLRQFSTNPSGSPTMASTDAKSALQDYDTGEKGIVSSEVMSLL